MMNERIMALRSLLKPTGIFSASLDDNELHRLGILLNQIFGEECRAACAPWKSEASGGKEKTGLRTGHEYILIYHNGDPTNITQQERSTGELDRSDKWGAYRKGRELRKWGGTSLREDRPNQWFALIAPDGSEVFPIRNDGREGHWRWGKNNENIKRALSDSAVFHWEKCPFDAGVEYEGQKDRWVPFQKIRNVTKTVGWSTWLDAQGTNADATRELKELFGYKPFDTPKPTKLYRWLVSLHQNEDAIVMDCFAGSGTTAHAVISLNEEDGGSRKYIVSDMGNVVQDVLIPRLKRVCYSTSWKDGKPVSREGVSHMFKYIRTESYEDTLNNLELRRTQEQGELLERNVELREDYVLHYMLDVEAKGNASLLDIRQLDDPFNYKLRVSTGSAGETKLATVDIVETFNWLLGLRVKHVDTIRGFHIVQGTNPTGEKALVIWRNTREKSNADLDEFFLKQGYNTRDMEFDLIYVNGDNNLENLKRPDETWKVRLIEEEFKNLMFDVEDV
jgi:adenine-specific DNA-methyltransferase